MPGVRPAHQLEAVQLQAALEDSHGREAVRLRDLQQVVPAEGAHGEARDDAPGSSEHFGSSCCSHRGQVRPPVHACVFVIAIRNRVCVFVFVM